MGFFLENPFGVKPSDLLDPDLTHPHLEGCTHHFAFLEGGGYSRNLGTHIADQFSISGGLTSPSWKQKDIHCSNGYWATNDYAAALVGEWTLFLVAKPDPGITDTYVLDHGIDPDIRNKTAILYGYQPNAWNIYTDPYPIGNNPALSQMAATGGVDVVCYKLYGSNLKGFVNGKKLVDGTHTDGLLQQYKLTLGAASNGVGTFDGIIRAYRKYDRALSDALVEEISNNFWQPFKHRIWVPTGPPGIVELTIDGLNHARPLDQVDVTTLASLLPIDSLRHGRRVDSFDLGVIVDLFIAGLRHGRLVDAVDIDVSISLVIDVLPHGRLIDAVDLQELVGILLIIGDMRHSRPVDSLLLAVDQSIVVDNLRHGRPIDAAGVQPLLGDQTGIGATAIQWILDAGQPLNNAALVDFDYHVLEGVFDSDQSVLGIDGTRVTGPAGMRELTALTLGANVDGQERVQGEIAELRIYAGTLSQADRDRILQELQQKWITG